MPPRPALGRLASWSPKEPSVTVSSSVGGSSQTGQRERGGRARGRQGLPPTPELPWGDPHPQWSAFQPQSRAWDVLTSAVIQEPKSLVGCTWGPCLSHRRVGPSGLQTRTPGATGPRLGGGGGGGGGGSGGPYPDGTQCCGGLSVNLPAEGEPTQSLRGLVG